VRERYCLQGDLVFHVVGPMAAMLGEEMVVCAQVLDTDEVPLDLAQNLCRRGEGDLKVGGGKSPLEAVGEFGHVHVVLEFTHNNDLCCRAKRLSVEA